MKKFVEKLIERLEEKTFTQMAKVQVDDIVFPPAYTYERCEVVTLDDVKAITIELAEEYKEPLTKDETQEIRTIIKQIHELFEEALDLNNYGEGTDLSRMVTTYLPNIEQSYKYFVERSVK